MVDVINNGFGSSSAPNWNVIRLNMDWPTHQIEQAGSVIVDPVALQELDTVIDAAKAQGLYVALVPAPRRWPDHRAA
ncbi:MAG: cellulase family glycosylhydrolase [Candidatus Microthrix sp.]|nr:cellulase family glycosylhydrolase [Candidatus Microthrix sp.]MBK9558026.1 cellulase family glycosylhydrolase [Candidatus Microthrix sp.]